MNIISWSQFERNQLAKDISFESFCFQVAYILFQDYGFFENFYNTPGSEFYLKLHKDCPALNLKSGDAIGWQVKWWFDSEENSSLNSNRKSKLLENFGTTLKTHPKLKKWIICTPGAFVEREYSKLKDELIKLSAETDFTHWDKAAFINFQAANFDNFHAVYNHYFNLNFIGFDFIKKHSLRKLDDLKKKYDTDLYTPSHHDDEVLYLIDYKRIFEKLETQSKYLQDELDKIERNEYFIKTISNSFTNEYNNQSYELLNLTVKTFKQVIALISSKMSIDKGKLILIIFQEHDKEYRKLADSLNNQIKTKSHLINEKEEIKVEDWHRDEFLIGTVNKIHSLLFPGENNDNLKYNILDLLNPISQKDIHILSSAGYGKTNISCNICNTLIQNNIPCLLILGSSFRKTDFPQTIILEQLDLIGKYTFKEFLHALNTLGFSKGVKIPIIVDGLNESTPYDAIWKTNIKDIIRDINELENVIFITTCRDRYIEAIFGENDISNIKNTKTLVGLDDKVRDLAIKKYFNKYNIIPSSWNFNQDLFKNPLLLRIFSEVNKNKSDIHISLYNLFDSIESYILNIEEIASTIKSSVDPIRIRQLKSRIGDFCEYLWKNNKREISIEDFHKIIAPESSSLIGSLTEKLLDEGLCFQRNLATENETVQFTYDLVGGYAIASKVLIRSITSKDNIVSILNQLGLESKIFCKETEHPLKQDILMSLLHLLPVKFGINLFELFENEEIIKECFNNIDYFIDNEADQEKLLIKISKERHDGRNYRLLFEKLFENLFKKGVHGLGEFTIKVLVNLNQAQIDIFWTELVRKNRIDVYQIVKSLNSNYKRNKIDNHLAEYDIQLSFLATSSSDKSIRSLATENLFLIAKKFPKEILVLARQILTISDLSTIESVIAAICGSVLSLKDKIHTINSLEFIANEFLPSFKSTHICIIDYIQTIVEYSLSTYGIDFRDRIIFDQKNFKIKKTNKISNKSNKGYSSHFPHLLGIDIYEFNKYQISGIASDSYHKRSTYTSVECLEIILNNIYRKGYNDTLFDSILKEFQDDKHYKYGRGNSNILSLYPEKYIWQSYYELVGFLVLSKKLKSEDKNRFRCNYIDFDPTFPRLPQRFQIIKECFFPSKHDNVQDWINSAKQNFLDDFFIHNLYTDTEWVLISANISQEGVENDTRFHLTINSFLIPNDRIKDFQSKIDKRDFIDISHSFYNLYAGEINWSCFSQTTESEYYEELLCLKEFMYEYSWSGYSSNRFDNPYFKFLNPYISNFLGLIFNTEDLSFYDSSGIRVTKIVWTENTILYYIKKDVLDFILPKLGLELVWYQFVSKYGEFGKYQDNKLNPTYKDLRQLIKYNSTNLGN